MKNLTLISLLFGLALIASRANAGLYLEPYLGYETGKIKVDGTITAPAPGTVTNNDNLSGTDFGGKVGYSILLFAFGVDYMGGSLKEKTTSGTANFTTTDIGAFINLKVPFIKVSATYFASSTMKYTAGHIDGSGFKVGVGFTGLPFIAINVDMIANEYKKVTDSTYTYSSFDAKRNTTMVSISLPLDL